MIFNRSVCFILDDTGICNVYSEHENVSDTERNVIRFLNFPGFINPMK
jgi:hypothetical protein